MNKQENKQQPCDPCERNFERNIHHIVREAFGEKHPEAVK